MSDLDLELREKYNIPDEKDTMEWCEENGIDYQEELIRIYISDKIQKGRGSWKSTIRAEDLARILNEQPAIPYDMKWNPDCEDCLPEGINYCIECHKRKKGRGSEWLNG